MTTTATRKPMTAEEKQARREAKKQANLTILGRATFKATGAVLFGIEDRNDKLPEVFHVTVIAGVVRSCVSTTTGESCDGRRWSGHCCHEKRVLAYEEQRESELAGAAQVAPMILGEQMAADLSAHIDDELSVQAPVFVRDAYDPRNGYVLTPNGLVEFVCQIDLSYFYPDAIERSDTACCVEVQRRLDAKKMVKRIPYRELFAADFN